LTSVDTMTRFNSIRTGLRSVLIGSLMVFSATISNPSIPPPLIPLDEFVDRDRVVFFASCLARISLLWVAFILLELSDFVDDERVHYARQEVIGNTTLLENGFALVMFAGWTTPYVWRAAEYVEAFKLGFLHLSYYVVLLAFAGLLGQSGFSMALHAIRGNGAELRTWKFWAGRNGHWTDNHRSEEQEATEPGEKMGLMEKV